MFNQLEVFNNFLSNEKSEPARGRYTFLHLILPHPPYRLGEDCAVIRNHGALAQFKCATRLITLLIQELQRLDRFDDSLILIHRNHGLNFRIEGKSITEISGELTSEKLHLPRSKALLLYKPFAKATNPFLEITDKKTTLLDIAPTIVNGINQPYNELYQGTPLTSMTITIGQQFYYYHLSSNEHEIYRYRLEDGSITFDQILEFD